MSSGRRKLIVWAGEHRVGELLLGADRRMTFCYDGDWLRQGFAISCSLPMEETGDFLPPDMRGHFFFENLLPEGAARNRLIRLLKVADDDFSLLEKLGGDCAGMLQLLPEETAPAGHDEQVVPLEEEVLVRTIASGSPAWLGAGLAVTLPRLSLAGAQDKLAVRRYGQGNALAIPVGQSASTHILKLPVSDVRNVPLYEAYTSFIAGALGLEVAPVTLLNIGGYFCSLSERYDRFVSEQGAVRRLHQEDFCQALGRSSATKYAGEGARLGDVADVLRQYSSIPALDLRKLVMWQVCNALLGNADGHLKNIALLRQRDGRYRLAPFYDLVCTRAIEKLDYMLALPVGGQGDAGVLQKMHWELMAKEMGVGPRLATNMARTLAEKLHEGLPEWDAAFRVRYGDHAVLQRPRQIMARMARKALKEW